jgi:hypothetical protein
VDEILGFLVLYDVMIVLFHVQIHICTEKRPVNTWPHCHVPLSRAIATIQVQTTDYCSVIWEGGSSSKQHTYAFYT